MKTLHKFYLVALALALPAVTQAQFGEIGGLFEDASTFINSTLIPLGFGVALLAFIFGIVKTLMVKGDDAESRKQGRSLMIWGIVGFVVMAGIWGIVNVVSGAFGIDQDADINVPNVPSQ